MDVVSQGAEGGVTVDMVEDIYEAQYGEFNAFPLSEQNRSGTAVGNNPRHLSSSKNGYNYMYK